MFGRRFFGMRFYGERYFGMSDVTPGGGGAIPGGIGNRGNSRRRRRS